MSEERSAQGLILPGMWHLQGCGGGSPWGHESSHMWTVLEKVRTYLAVHLQGIDMAFVLMQGQGTSQEGENVGKDFPLPS